MLDELRRENDALKNEIARLSGEIAALSDLAEQLEAEKRVLQDQVDLLKQQIFGRRSERYRPEHPGQQLIFEEELSREAIEEIERSIRREEASESERRRRRTPRKRRGPKPLPDNLPREDRVVDLEEEEKCCAHGHARVKTGEKVTEELEYVPARYIVVRWRQAVYKALGCQHRECQREVVATTLARPIDEGRAGCGLLAHVVVSKYGDHQPLYRQSEILRREGIDLARSTLCGWVHRAAELLSPIVGEMRRQLLSGDFLQADETTLRTLAVPAKGGAAKKSHQAYLWGYGTPWGEVVYDYSLDRSKKNPFRFLGRFRGALQIDGYQGYNRVFSGGEVIRLGCFAHARRKFHQALKDSPDEARTVIAALQILYRLERRMKERGYSPEQKARERRRVAKPLLESLEKLLKVYRKGCRPTSKLGKAISYTVNEWPYLVRYVDVGQAEIDNNSLENTLRPVALGRKNYLFAGSPSGGRTAAVLYSLVTSCKRLGINPWEYLKDVLERISTHPAARIHELTPRGWMEARSVSPKSP